MTSVSGAPAHVVTPSRCLSSAVTRQLPVSPEFPFCLPRMAPFIHPKAAVPTRIFFIAQASRF